MLSFEMSRLDEREAASIVAGLHSNIIDASLAAEAEAAGVVVSTASSPPPAVGANKRGVRDIIANDDVPEGGGGTGTENTNDEGGDAKRSRKKPAPAIIAPPPPPVVKPSKARKDPPMDATGLVFAQPELKPAPYFYYSDHSLEEDDDPLMPITAVGSVPTFPAKMHAILTNPALADVIGWAPHGRSWRILKPRDFEIRVLPKYFEHSKFSSFVRQANGWGFRRMSEGYEKNAYYHEYFLRAMPWLCKKMRRPKVAEKKAVDPDMEPDLDAISWLFPVPDRPPTREVLVLQKTIELGPKARMPILWDTGSPHAAPSSPVRRGGAGAVEGDLPSRNVPPMSLNHSFSHANLKQAAVVVPAPQQAAAPALPAPPPHPVVDIHAGGNVPQRQATADYATAAAARGGGNASAAPPAPAPSSSSSSDSLFAAGFMAATNFHSIQIRSMLESAFLAGLPVQAAIAAANAAVPPAAANLGHALGLLRAGGVPVPVGTGGAYHHVPSAPPPPPHHHHQTPFPPRADPRSFASHSGYGNDGNNAVFHGGGGGQHQLGNNNLSEQAMMLRQLQQFQAYQARGGDLSQFPFQR